MAATQTLPALLDTLARSLTSTTEVAAKIDNLQPTKDGISLLDVKNDLLLSYLQNLVFLILLKVRDVKCHGEEKSKGSSDDLRRLVVKKLVELRVYLERGARPLEDKLRYQIDKVLRAAEDAERNEKAQQESTKATTNGNAGNSEDDDVSDDDLEDSDIDGNHRNLTAKPATTATSDLQHRANLSAFATPTEDKKTSKTGIYKPPRIAPTVMPTTERRDRPDPSQPRRPLRSAIMEEFIADELSGAPTAQPSVGTTIRDGGRKIRTASDRKEEEEKRQYEEMNFVRLPKESKKDKVKNAAARRKAEEREVFGGEDWRELGEGVDRINRVTGRSGKGGGGRMQSALEKSRKRGRDTVDGPRGSGGGVEMGERFQKRLKALEREKSGKGKRR